MARCERARQRSMTQRARPSLQRRPSALIIRILIRCSMLSVRHSSIAFLGQIFALQSSAASLGAASPPVAAFPLLKGSPNLSGLYPSAIKSSPRTNGGGMIGSLAEFFALAREILIVEDAMVLSQSTRCSSSSSVEGGSRMKFQLASHLRGVLENHVLRTFRPCLNFIAENRSRRMIASSSPAPVRSCSLNDSAGFINCRRDRFATS